MLILTQDAECIALEAARARLEEQCADLTFSLERMQMRSSEIEKRCETSEALQLLRQYSYFCTSTASKLST
jgi:hypothetical protein